MSYDAANHADYRYRLSAGAGKSAGYVNILVLAAMALCIAGFWIVMNSLFSRDDIAIDEVLARLNSSSFPARVSGKTAETQNQAVTNQVLLPQLAGTKADGNRNSGYADIGQNYERVITGSSAKSATAARRTEALAHWCEGFLHGLVSSERSAELEKRLAAEPIADIIRDMLEMTRAVADGADAREEEEQAYAEIVEYLRIAAQLVYEELADTPPAVSR
jgi:hypothetical protein